LESGCDPGCSAWLSTLDGSPTLPGLRFSHAAVITVPVDAFNAITLASTASSTDTSSDFVKASKRAARFPLLIRFQNRIRSPTTHCSLRATGAVERWIS